MKSNSPVRRARLDERGVALPLALFGLVAVSLLVTSALLTSSTELAISQAHQDGTRALYAADGALEEFLYERATIPGDVPDRLSSQSYPVGGFSIQVARLFQVDSTYAAGDSVARVEKYSLVAGREDGRGRSVASLVGTIKAIAKVALNIEAGLTLGTNTTITGNATISDGSSAGSACTSDPAPAAIQHASGTEVEQKGGAHDIYGEVVEDDLEAGALMAHVLDGHSIDDLTDMATLRFGDMFGEDAFNNGSGPKQTAGSPEYRWGCPTQLVGGCTAEQAQYFPAVAIDAEGGTVDITGDHGQGILIIRNGGAHIRGNFHYAGIIIVEGSLEITGTPRLEGAVVAMGDETVIDPGDDSGASGNSLIRYNQCEIAQAQEGLTMQALELADQQIHEPSSAWFEVVR